MDGGAMMWRTEALAEEGARILEFIEACRKGF